MKQKEKCLPPPKVIFRETGTEIVEVREKIYSSFISCEGTWSEVSNLERNLSFLNSISVTAVIMSQLISCTYAREMTRNFIVGSISATLIFTVHFRTIQL